MLRIRVFGLGCFELYNLKLITQNSKFVGPTEWNFFGFVFILCFQNLFLKISRYKNENWEQVYWCFQFLKTEFNGIFVISFNYVGLGAVCSHVTFRPLELSLFLASPWLKQWVLHYLFPYFLLSSFRWHYSSDDITHLTHLSEPT